MARSDGRAAIRYSEAPSRFTRLGLTAANFDMLTAIWRHPCRVFQRKLRGMLGVTAPTISRMLRSLEELGLIARERGLGGDRRQLHVRLTDAGLALIRFRDIARLHYPWHPDD